MPSRPAMNDGSDPNLPPADRELEHALRSLTPAAASLSLEAIAFQAGRRSLRTHVATWRGASGVLAVALVASQVLPAAPNRNALSRAPIAIATPPASPTPLPPAAEDFGGSKPVNNPYLLARADVLRHGLDGLGDSASTAVPRPEVPAARAKAFDRAGDALLGRLRARTAPSSHPVFPFFGG
jgi:hypothetical protein